MAYYLSMEFRGGSVGCSGLRSLVWLIWTLARAAVISRLAWAGASISRMAHSHGQQAGVGCRWDASVPLYRGPSTGLLRTLNSRICVPQNKRSRQKGYSLRDLPVEMTKHHVCHVRCQALILVHIQRKKN